jgi:hypothetical protein
MPVSCRTTDHRRRIQIFCTETFAQFQFAYLLTLESNDSPTFKESKQHLSEFLDTMTTCLRDYEYIAISQPKCHLIFLLTSETWERVRKICRISSSIREVDDFDFPDVLNDLLSFFDNASLLHPSIGNSRTQKSKLFHTSQRQNLKKP